MTFLVTDIEGSTALARRIGDAYQDVLDRHHALLRREFQRHAGHDFKETGDGFWVAFAAAGDALACAIACQRALAAEPWPEIGHLLRVRMALHVADVEPKNGDYHGLALHYASRLLGAAHGGQILLSEATQALVHRHLKAGMELTDLGVFRLRDAPAPERLFQLGYPDMPQRDFGPPNAPPAHTPNLPATFTRFVGREQERARLEEMLLQQEIRLLTLTGTGGSGKTRLAVEVARNLVDAFSGAVWFVPLTDLSDPRLIGDNVLSALRLSHSPNEDPVDQVVELLTHQPSLLVLDNFEQLVPGGAFVVRTLLERAPTLTCLVTSRQRLGLSAEREFEVLPLPTPTTLGTRSQVTPARLNNNASVQLFVDRAQGTRPDFQVSERNAAAVAELCDRLEGIPLAIELAASWAKMLAPSQMLTQLEDFLVSRDRCARRRRLKLDMDVPGESGDATASACPR